jgi:3-oxoadipate CoA-transferase beta subunit
MELAIAGDQNRTATWCACALKTLFFIKHCLIDGLTSNGKAVTRLRPARQVFVMMEHLTRDGESKIVHSCTYPLTAIRSVNRIYTDLAVLDIAQEGLVVREMIDGLMLDELQALSGVPLGYRPFN